MTYQQYLDGLKVKVAELNQLSDNAAYIVKQVEASLARLSIGVEASVSAANGTRLVYSRIGEHFRIGVMSSQETKPWSDCSRGVKLATFNRLEALLAEISKEVDLKIAIARGLRDPDPTTPQEITNEEESQRTEEAIPREVSNQAIPASVQQCRKELAKVFRETTSEYRGLLAKDLSEAVAKGLTPEKCKECSGIGLDHPCSAKSRNTDDNSCPRCKGTGIEPTPAHVLNSDPTSKERYLENY